MHANLLELVPGLAGGIHGVVIRSGRRRQEVVVARDARDMQPNRLSIDRSVVKGRGAGAKTSIRALVARV